VVVPLRPTPLLERASVYNISQRLVGKPNVYRVFVGEYLRPTAGARILDIACGTGELLKYLPAVSYLGVDISDAYIACARRRYADRAEFLCADLTQLAVGSGTFDLVVAIGVLHHLDDPAATALTTLARRALRPGGRFVALEPCRLPGQPLIAKVVIAVDRGAHVREREGYERVLRPHFAEVRSELRGDLLFVPSTHVILECHANVKTPSGDVCRETGRTRAAPD
jgi:SAM-dependent methyltransferase